MCLFSDNNGWTLTLLITLVNISSSPSSLGRVAVLKAIESNLMSMLHSLSMAQSVHLKRHGNVLYESSYSLQYITNVFHYDFDNRWVQSRDGWVRSVARDTSRIHICSSMPLCRYLVLSRRKSYSTLPWNLHRWGRMGKCQQQPMLNSCVRNNCKALWNSQG